MSLVEKAALIAHRAAFANAGQCCVAGTRTYVQAGIYDKFVAKAAEIAKKRSVGNPFTDVEQGPQVTIIYLYYLLLFKVYWQFYISEEIQHPVFCIIRTQFSRQYAK